MAKLHRVEEEQETKLKMTEALREGLLENEPLRAKSPIAFDKTVRVRACCIQVLRKVVHLNAFLLDRAVCRHTTTNAYI